MKNLLEKYRPSNFEEFIGNMQAIELIKGLLRKNIQPLLIILIASWGLGKSSLMRIIAKCVQCANHGQNPCVPCGVCDYCRNITAGYNLPSFREIDSTRITAEELRSIVNEIDYQPTFYRESSVVIVDEFQRLIPSMRDMLLKVIEKDSRVTWLLSISADKANEIRDDFRQRGAVITIEPPSTEEMVKKLEQICALEEIEHGDGALERIVEYSANIPRQSIMNLQKLMALQKQITVDLADKVLPR